MHDICQNKSTFCIGIANLNSEPLATGDDIWWAICLITDEIFNHTDAASSINDKLFVDYCLKSWEATRCSVFIEEHIPNTAGCII